MNIFLIFTIFIILNKKINANKRDLINVEKHLTEKLLEKYDKKTRPSDTSIIKFSLYLNQIIDLMEQEQIFVINVFLDHEWKDERLKWNATEYENISLIRISNELLWT
jgi:methanogenic corrinoid protein MtbC1